MRVLVLCTGVHMGFDDPDAFTGSEETITREFRRVRDEIGQKMSAFVNGLK